MQRRAAEESLTDHGKDNSNGRAHVGDAIRHKPGILGFLRQIGFMGATAKSDIAQQVATAAGREYVDVRALLLDPVDLRGIPWRDGADRTRWAPPSFLPPSDDPGRWLINLEELPSAVPMVQAALYQLVLDRKCGEYELPEGASLIRLSPTGV